MGFLDKFRKRKWEHKDKDVRIEAIETLDDQEILINLAKNDESSDVRKEAVSKISDEKTLINIAKNNSYSAVRKEAVSKISDDKELLNILKNEKSTTVRHDIIRYHIKNKETLKKIAIEDEYLSNRYYARNSMLTDEIIDDIKKYDVEKYEKLDFKKLEGEPPTNKILVELLNANLTVNMMSDNDYAARFKAYYQSGDSLSIVKLLFEWNKDPDVNCLLAYFIFFSLEMESGVTRDLNLLEYIYERGLSYSIWHSYARNELTPWFKNIANMRAGSLSSSSYLSFTQKSKVEKWLF